MTGVGPFDEVVRFERHSETGPSRVTVVLAGRGEQRFPGDDVDVDACFLVGPVFVAERRLGGSLLGDASLLSRQPADRLRIFAVVRRHGCSFPLDGGRRWGGQSLLTRTCAEPFGTSLRWRRAG